MIQLPAFFAFGRLEHGKYDESADNVVKLEHPWFILGVVLCFLAFAAYLWWCVKTSQDNENTSSKVDVLIDNAISDGKLTLTGAFFNDLSFSQRRDSISGDNSESQSLLANDPVARAQRRVEQFLHKKFTKCVFVPYPPMRMFECICCVQEIVEVKYPPFSDYLHAHES